MRLGKDTGSTVNQMMSLSDHQPRVGHGATVLHWSDRHAYWVDWVSEDGKECQVSRALTFRTDQNGMSDCQSYRYERNPDVERMKFNLRYRYGSWWLYEWDENGVEKIFTRKLNIVFGRMDEYYDYSF